MKKLSLLFLLPILFFSCSSDDNDNEPKQDYTSFVVSHNEEVTLPNCIAAYKEGNEFLKIANLGELVKGKYSLEVRINNNSIKEIFIFSDYNNVIRFDDTYALKSGAKNNIVIKPHTKGILISDKTDPTQYPQ